MDLRAKNIFPLLRRAVDEAGDDTLAFLEENAGTRKKEANPGDGRALSGTYVLVGRACDVSISRDVTPT